MTRQRSARMFQLQSKFQIQLVDALFCPIRFGLQPCPVCLGDPQDPLSLPCKHIYCLGCIKQWLAPGQMYCPLCMREVPDDLSFQPSEDIRYGNTHLPTSKEKQ